MKTLMLVNGFICFHVDLENSIAVKATLHG